MRTELKFRLACGCGLRAAGGSQTSDAQADHRERCGFWNFVRAWVWHEVVELVSSRAPECERLYGTCRSC